jgi:site-specific recombinase XerD
VLETFYAIGIRVSELANLTVSDVDTEERLLRIVLGKGRKDRNVPLTSAAAEAIAVYLERGRPQLVGARLVPYLFLADGYNGPSSLASSGATRPGLASRSE